jgi:DNA-binding NarL/FixJ family response regulator
VIRVVVADDQTAVREGLTLLLDLLDDITVVGAAADGDEALRLVAEHAPDVALMDLRMPGCDGIAATARIRDEHPGTRVVVLTTYAEDADILAALRAGALGYLTKDANRQQVAQAVHGAAAGNSVLDPAVSARLLAVAGAPEPADGGARPVPDNLTAREVDVLRLIAAGLSNREIASKLFLSEATVKSHINRLFAKAAIRDRAGAVRYAYRHGLAAPER